SRCNARIHTQFGSVIKEVNKHSHNSSVSNVEVAKAYTALKRRAVDTIEKPSVVISEILTNVSQVTLGSLPDASAMRKTIKRKRRAVSAPPPTPVDLQELELPHQYKIYIPEEGREENFLIGDSGPGLHRILLFGRESWLQHLQSSDTWYGDGTFKIAPRLFSQVYIILAKKFNGVIPIIYALLPNKQRSTYSKMFEMLKDLEPTLSPTSIICDFEHAAFTAMKEVFPEVEIKGCFFHLSQNMHRKITAMGYTSMYNNDASFALRAKMILSLAFVPLAHIDTYVDALSVDINEELATLLNWFEDNYIGRPNRRGNGRRPPLFPPEMWNVYERTLQMEDRTNNHAEAANRRLQTELGMEHPTIWRFIKGLQKVQRNRDAFFEQLIGGHPPPPKLKKYMKADDRIRHIVYTFSERAPTEYLRGIAYNFN
ncbi:uncharacterized protein LOC143024138, partial [Oratosquilla oratoria]|uniref:uncharacterized protein LOC143024138 n=1 Tax=Oratosquilla oratoria TaxID=337810 RepID=UPI003F762E3C